MTAEGNPVRRLAGLLSLSLFVAAGAAEAHKPSDSYLALQIAPAAAMPPGATAAAAPVRHAVHGRWDIALRDLDFALGLDADGDGQLTWDEVRSRHADIGAYAMPRLGLGSGCVLRVAGHRIDRHSDGAYAVLLLQGDCQPGAVVAIDYSLFAELDAQHRGLASVNVNGTVESAVLGGDRTRLAIKADGNGDGGARWQRQGGEYLRHGIRHIWTGYDHILFLLSLLLPAVLAASMRASSMDVLRIVTAFTLAHSITLSLSALHLAALPARLVESAIAASVAIAALNNLWPLVQGKRWLAAFAFGLLHGFGFAGVLGGLGLPQGAAAIALAAFNAGVELGQLAIVAVFLPLAYAMRRSWIYRKLVVKGGSACIGMLALVWLVERAAA